MIKIRKKCFPEPPELFKKNMQRFFSIFKRFPHCSKSPFFVQKFNFNFPRKLSIFLGEKLVIWILSKLNGIFIEKFDLVFWFRSSFYRKKQNFSFAEQPFRISKRARHFFHVVITWPSLYRAKVLTHSRARARFKFFCEKAASARAHKRLQILRQISIFQTLQFWTKSAKKNSSK